MPKAEVLSPAGNFEALVAAVRSGADAVYIGSTEFSARRNAGNFDNAALKEAVSYCHIRGVKVYLTLNIMIKNSEFEEALALAEYANDIGVDGIILADAGLSYVIGKAFPDIEIHASTQMTVHTPAALPFLKNIGFSRVVTSRELSGTELKKFCAAARKCQTEVECFVHGALCMCVSGQCLLSAVLGRRSGNRGLCAGPCRLPFSASGGTGHDLSLKDLSLIDKVPELENMGVASLKIEGRMKRPEYVAAATAAVRQASESGKADENLKSLLSSVFSRSGFTKGYFNGRTGREMFGIRTKEDVTAAREAFAEIHKIYRAERQNIPLCITSDIKKNAKITVSYSCGEYSVSVGAEPPQTAQNKPTDKAASAAALAKLGGTPYFAEKTDVNIEDGLFVPASVLNGIRRKATEELDIKRSAPPFRRKEKAEITVKDRVHGEDVKIFARFLSPDMIPENTENTDGIILPAQYDFPDLPENILKITDAPRYIRDDEALKKRLSYLKKSGVEYALCGNISAAADALAVGMKVIGDIGLNVANDAAAAVFGDMGLSAVTLSAELTLSDIGKVKTKLKKGVFAYGRLPLMLTVNCPLKNGRSCTECDKKGFLTDRMGVNFPVRCRDGYSELYNSAPVYLADRLSEIKGVDYLILSFTDESREEAERILKAYKNGGQPAEKFTRGLYFKGVL